MQFLRRLFSRPTPAPAEVSYIPPQPERPVIVIGDIHGRLDLLERLLARLDRDHHDARKVFVGDYVDRGPNSRGVLDRLQGLSDAICLTGNHEQMMLGFLDDPTEHSDRWLRNGGGETLASYGIPLDPEPSAAAILFAARTLADTMTQEGIAWLRDLPLQWRSGNVLVTHAGPDPTEPFENQPEKVFTWGHNQFLRRTRTDGIWVAHGHWALDKPFFGKSRISVDTGAWFTGKLTAARIDPDGDVRFITA